MSIEIEKKFTLPEGATITDLGEKFVLGEPERHQLAAIYFDTPSFTLARNKVTLRRRTGGTDAGWHLKLPAGKGARTEVHAPILPGRSRLQVPLELREQVAKIVGAEPLVPVVELSTRRVETPVSTPRGRRLALLADDTVTAIRCGQERSWRELEAELAGGDEADLALISEALMAAGAMPKASPSKLVEALGDELRQPAPLDGRSTAAEVLTGYIAAQVGMVQSREAGARVDAPEAVHKMRVATRRLRSTLATFSALFDEERTAPLGEEVKWLAEQLGGPRDAEVLKARLLAAVDELPDEAVLGPVAENLARELDRRHEESLAALVIALNSPRYRQLMDSLVGLVTDPPVLEQAQRRAGKALAAPLQKAATKVTRRWEAALATVDEAAREELVHEARKKAKAARYAWEAAAPAFAEGRATATCWSEVTEVLGTAQDTVVARERLRELAEAAEASGEPSFTLGVLWQRELAHEQAARDDGGEAVVAAAKATRKALKKP